VRGGILIVDFVTKLNILKNKAINMEKPRKI